jgi:hypothetical protein
VDQRQSGCDQHRLGQTGDAANHIETDAPRTGQLLDKRGDGRRCVLELAVEAHDTIVVDGGDPVDFIGDVDAER